MNTYILDNPPDGVFEDTDENAESFPFPIEELTAFKPAACMQSLNVVATALFAEALQEADWIGSPVELDFNHGILLGDLHKVAGAIWAYLPFIPVIELSFPTLEDAEAYAAHRIKTNLWLNTESSPHNATLEESLWTPQATDTDPS